MKLFTLLFCFLFSLTTALGQSFYEISWMADRQYVAMVVYYDESEIDVRVKYLDDNQIYHVAKYNCTGMADYDEDGTKYYMFVGHDAEVVHTSKPINSSYIADNFIFANVNENNVFETLFTIDHAALETDVNGEKLIEAEFRSLDPYKDFTEQYIFNFFDEHEPEYKVFLDLAHASRPNPVQPTPDPDPQVEKPVFHLVFVADTEDRSIGLSTAQDMEDVSTTFKKISRELGLEMRETRLHKQSFNVDEIQKSLNELRVGSNDILIYYYSGHGYSNTEKVSNFPTMSLDGPDYGLEQMYQDAISKNARLTMIVGDLCNSLPQTRVAVGRRENLPFKSGYLFDTDKLRKMFVESSGTVISTSSQRGEWSFCMTNPDGSMGGGHFTHAFIESIIKESSKASIETGDWNNVFSRAYMKANTATSTFTNQNGKKGQTGFNQVRIYK